MDIHPIKRKKIAEKKVVTLSELSDILNCSPRTAQRRIAQWRFYRSYNKNGKYYALPDIPKFDDYGLWKHKGIYFSRHGNLLQTIIHFIKHSSSGIDSGGLEKILGCSIRAFLSSFKESPPFKRKKEGKNFIYYSNDTEEYVVQQRLRRDLYTSLKKQLPEDAEAVLILVDRIKYPESSIEQCYRRLKKKYRQISPETIRNLLEYHGILKKTTAIG